MGRTLLAVVILMPILVVFGCIANEFVSLLFLLTQPLPVFSESRKAIIHEYLLQISVEFFDRVANQLYWNSSDFYDLTERACSCCIKSG